MADRKLCRRIVSTQGYPANWIDALSESELDELVVLCAEDGEVSDDKVVKGFKEFQERHACRREAENGKAVLEELEPIHTLAEDRIET